MFELPPRLVKTGVIRSQTCASNWAHDSISKSLCNSIRGDHRNDYRETGPPGVQEVVTQREASSETRLCK